MQRRIPTARKTGGGLSVEHLRPIRRQHADAVTAAQPALNQQRRQPGDAVLDLAVCHLEAVLGERHTFGTAAQGGQHQIAKRGGVVQSGQSILPVAVPFAEARHWPPPPITDTPNATRPPSRTCDGQSPTVRCHASPVLPPSLSVSESTVSHSAEPLPSSRAWRSRPASRLLGDVDCGVPRMSART